MDRDFFLNAGLHFEPSSQMPSWKLMSSVPVPVPVPEQSHVDRFNTFESNLTSMVSSPISTPTDTFSARELIGKLGNGGGEVSVSPATIAPAAAQNLNWSTVDNLVRENTPTLRNSIPFGHTLPSLAADPGFAERAAKFSCFGSRSFNGRTTTTSQLGLNSNSPDLPFRSSNVSPLLGKTKMPRVSSSPSLKIDGSAMGVLEIRNSIETRLANGSGCEKKTNSNSNEESSVSEQMETGLKNPNSSNPRKRKAKEVAVPIVKEEGTEEDVVGETEKKLKVPEPPKDYIHVRARRGQATDSHSLAERVRREKISERMKLLQDLVPGCNKVTGKALMLDEIINYVQSLQHQVEFLSMKLATVDPGEQDLDVNSHISKDINQPIANLSQHLYPMESSTSDFYQPNPQQVLFVGSTPITHSPVDPLPPIHGFTEPFSQFAGFEGDDLHSIVKMGFGENRDQTSEMKIEL
ncbi:hypothetical protein SSX86_011289 [Deinandra increscens subsp. villosa]|uniref:BHLH domain-containing protein n=1 Tax=Deinandra increscens subsp. villosa TaxID=3103831 RepID=A0AAP0D698_9ASTR